MPKRPQDERIVSSEHLADTEAWQLSEFEYALIMAFNGFSRWTLRCMSAAGHGDLGALEILVLHHVYHRQKPKRLNDIAFALNVDDVHTVNYALRKAGEARADRRREEPARRSSTRPRRPAGTAAWRTRTCASAASIRRWAP